MKRWLKWLLEKAGLRITRLRRGRASRPASVRVGRYEIWMPGNNPLLDYYQSVPDLNSFLGELTRRVAAKYPSLVVIDIGANVGDTLAVIKSAVDLPVIAIEGDPVSYGFLQRNAGQFREVTPVNSYLGETAHEVAATLDKEGWNTTLVPAADGEKKITLRTLDEILAGQELAAKSLKLLKVDCEGYDTIILRGATELLKAQKPVLYFEFNRRNMEAIGENGLKSLFSLQRFGYPAVMVLDNFGRYLLTARLEQVDLLSELYGYSGHVGSAIEYFDLCLFHEEDQDLAKKLVEDLRALGLRPLGG